MGASSPYIQNISSIIGSIAVNLACVKGTASSGHSGCNVLGAAPKNPFSLFFADEVGKKERKEHYSLWRYSEGEYCAFTGHDIT